MSVSRHGVRTRSKGGRNTRRSVIGSKCALTVDTVDCQPCRGANHPGHSGRRPLWKRAVKCSAKPKAARLVRRLSPDRRPRKSEWSCRPGWGTAGVAKLHRNLNQEIVMTTRQKVARRKLSLLELAGELGNVSRACQVMGYSRQQFYEIRRNSQTYGSQGLWTGCPGRERARERRPQGRLEIAPSGTAVSGGCISPYTQAAGNIILIGVPPKPPDNVIFFQEK